MLRWPIAIFLYIYAIYLCACTKFLDCIHFSVWMTVVK